MDDNTLNDNNSNNTTIHIIYNPEYYDEELRHIIKKARQNEKYKLPIHANYYKWGKDINIRPYLPLFAGIGIEKLYLFYTHALRNRDIHGISNGINKKETYRDVYGVKRNMYNEIWEDMLMMVKDPIFVRKLRKLAKFTENDLEGINNGNGGAMISIIQDGQKELGFDRKQALYFLVDIVINSLEHKIGKDNHQIAILPSRNYDPLRLVLLFQIIKGKWPVEDRLHVLKTLYTRKVKTRDINTNANDNIGKESFLYELNFEKLREHERLACSDEHFKEEVLDNLDFMITIDEETQTEEN